MSPVARQRREAGGTAASRVRGPRRLRADRRSFHHWIAQRHGPCCGRQRDADRPVSDHQARRPLQHGRCSTGSSTTGSATRSPRSSTWVQVVLVCAGIAWLAVSLTLPRLKRLAAPAACILGGRSNVVLARAAIGFPRPRWSERFRSARRRWVSRSPDGRWLYTTTASAINSRCPNSAHRPPAASPLLAETAGSGNHAPAQGPPARPIGRSLPMHTHDLELPPAVSAGARAVQQ